jgi:hypothetical protein
MNKYTTGELRLVEQQLAQMQNLMVSREEIKGSIFGLEKMIERMEAQQKNNSANNAARAADAIRGIGEYPGPELTTLSSMAVPTPEPTPIWRGAQQVLETAKRPMSAPDITELMQAMGWSIAGDTPVETVRTALVRKPDIFERTDRGMFQLKCTVFRPGRNLPAGVCEQCGKQRREHVARTEPPPEPPESDNALARLIAMQPPPNRDKENK